jgi:release factor H-coupled RctB family protein
VNTLIESNIRLLASARNWVEAEALRQFCAAARLKAVRLAVGLPDLHAGKRHPVGAAFLTGNVIYPELIGEDIGCGLGLWKTDLHPRDVRLDRWAGLPFDLELPWEGNVAATLARLGLPADTFEPRFGTLGAGSHFAELQAVDKVQDAAAFAQMGLGRGQLLLLVHSGSRGLGGAALNRVAQASGAGGMCEDSPAAAQYLEQHDTAVRWAKGNRALLAQRFLTTLGAHGESVLDFAHNSLVSRELEGERVWLHRKGAAPADEGPIVIPGSCGTLSYLVQPLGDGVAHAWSLAHGAGRKWSPSVGKTRARERHRADELAETTLGSRVICARRELLYEVAPLTYKHIEVVIADLAEAGLISVIATLRPVLTYKTRHAKWLPA